MKQQETKTRTTLKDIAREAQLSPSTISLVLRNPETTRVSIATRKRVIEIAESLNYRPNLLARSLVGQKSSTLGLVITTLLNPFYAETTQAIIERAKQDGYGVLASSVGNGGPEVEQQYANELLDRGVDGLIICSALRKDPVINDLRKRGVPFVLALRAIDEGPSDQPVDFVGVDDRRGSALITEHLLKMGHTRIALISGPQVTSTGYYRLAGALAAFEARGLKADPSLIFKGDYSRKTGYKLTMEIIRTKSEVTAIISANDIMAMGALEALAERVIKVPDDIALVGFDDIEMAGLPGVELTTISHPKHALGRLAVEQLLAKIKGESDNVIKKSFIDPVLVIRKTCGYHTWKERRKNRT
ncbi:MAG: LacI family DNA-binding transcriptional regulator [Deltaproteobacteria bacterium]|jgi:DNA-binding LacI/PurR family transcriptional regulator|nr:LacI family DNA-binding transcriptional regulator [Deltaproteobacteria bacterium]